MMTEHSTEFLEQYPKGGYGPTWRRNGPDFTKCAESVADEGRWPTFHQCTRKNGHGPHGAWCKQHDPVAVEAKRKARSEAWSREWKAKANETNLRTEALTIIRQIAEGHNDPASLCRDWCERWDAK